MKRCCHYRIFTGPR